MNLYPIVAPETSSTEGQTYLVWSPTTHQIGLTHRVAASTCPLQEALTNLALLSPTLAGEKETHKHQTGTAPQHPQLSP